MLKIKVELDDSTCRCNPTKAAIKSKSLNAFAETRKRFYSGKMSHTTTLTVSKKALNKGEEDATTRREEALTKNDSKGS